jgi:hypothetical protein
VYRYRSLSHLCRKCPLDEQYLNNKYASWNCHVSYGVMAKNSWGHAASQTLVEMYDNWIVLCFCVYKFWAVLKCVIINGKKRENNDTIVIVHILTYRFEFMGGTAGSNFRTAATLHLNASEASCPPVPYCDWLLCCIRGNHFSYDWFLCPIRGSHGS